MKTLLIFLLPFTMLFSTEDKSTESKPSTEAMVKSFTIGVGVEYGRPSKDCAKGGICFILETGIMDIKGISVRETGGFATMSGDSNGGTIILDFFKKSMKDSELKEHFSGKHFILEEAYKTSLKTKKHGTINLNLKAGKYKIQESKNGFKVKIAQAK